jgi:hypothetical protein
MLQNQANRIAMQAAGADVPEDNRTLLDFCFFADRPDDSRPPQAAGAAMLALLERELLPWFAINGPWAAELQSQGQGVEPPGRLCWAADGAILLAPYRTETGWGGFLIAEAKAAGQVLSFADERGQEVALQVPADAVPPRAFAAARADADLPLAMLEGRES